MQEVQVRRDARGGRRYSRYWWSVLFGWLIDRGCAVCWLCVGTGGAALWEDAELTGWNQPAGGGWEHQSGDVSVWNYFVSSQADPEPACLKHSHMSELMLVFDHLLQWNITLDHLSFLCIQSTGYELITTEVEDFFFFSQENKSAVNSYFLHNRESNIFLMRDIKKRKSQRLRVRELFQFTMSAYLPR